MNLLEESKYSSSEIWCRRGIYISESGFENIGNNILKNSFHDLIEFYKNGNFEQFITLFLSFFEKNGTKDYKGNEIFNSIIEIHSICEKINNIETTPKNLVSSISQKIHVIFGNNVCQKNQEKIKKYLRDIQLDLYKNIHKKLTGAYLVELFQP